MSSQNAGSTLYILGVVAADAPGMDLAPAAAAPNAAAGPGTHVPSPSSYPATVRVSPPPGHSHGCAGRLTAKNGSFRPGQESP